MLESNTLVLSKDNISSLIFHDTVYPIYSFISFVSLTILEIDGQYEDSITELLSPLQLSLYTSSL